MTNPDYPHDAGSADYTYQPVAGPVGSDGQAPSASDQYGPPSPYGPPSQYAASPEPYAQNPFGQNPYGQNPYAQNSYGQPYAQDPYAPNPYPPNAAMPYGVFGTPPAGDPGTLDRPYYGIGFVEAIKRFYRKYARFDGRASRSEFWWVALYLGSISFVVQTLSAIASAASASTSDPTWSGPVVGGLGVLLAVLWLAHIVPGIALAIRRLHDANYAGVYCLMALIPLAGPIILIVLTASATSPAGTRFDRPSAGSSQPY